MEKFSIVIFIIIIIVLFILINFFVLLIKWMNLKTGDKVSIIKEDSIRGILINKGVITDISYNYIIISYKHKFKSEKFTFKDYIRHNIKIIKNLD